MIRWFFVSCLLAGACHAGPSAPSPQVPQSAAAAPAPAPARDEYTRRVTGGRLRYRFRASKLSNLFYTVDCLAGTVHCTRESFEQLATRALGGLTTEDRKLLEEWRLLRRRYQGRVDQGAAPSVLPLPRSHARIERRVRLAGYLASDLDEYTKLASMLLGVGDAERAHAILAHFMPRFDRYWQREAWEVLRSSVDQFARAAETPALAALVDRITAFYAPALAPDPEITFELILRPPGTKSAGEQLAHVSLIEVEPGEAPSQRLDVVLHEVFHYFLSQVPAADLAAQMERFATSADPLAYVAQGALDEGLASALGNGLVLGSLAPSELARRRARPRGMYDDEVIDRMAREAIDPLERLLAAGEPKVTDAAFVPRWLEIAHTAFPDGAPPSAYLRPFVGAYAPELEQGVDSIDRVISVAHSATDGTLDPEATREMFAERPHWTRALFLRPADVPRLARWSHLVDAAAARAIRQHAHAHDSFVHASGGQGAPLVLVFVAPDSPALTRLLERFAAVPMLRRGVLTE